jgi:mRNA interferase MazF
MTTYKRGAVVLVPFPFTDLSAIKRRPALVISIDRYNALTGDVVIAQITSKVQSPARPGDHRVGNWQEAGLVAPSLTRARVATLHSSVVIKQLGVMPEGDLAQIDAAIGSALGLRPAV